MALVSQYMDRLPGGVEGAVTALALMVALLQCFMGYRLLKLWVALAGAAVGLVAGIIIGMLFMDNPAAVTVLALILMILGGILAFRIYKVGVFLVCGVAAWSLVMGILTAALGPQTAWWMEAVSLIAGILMGAVGVRFLRTAIIFSTAIPNGLRGGAGIMTLMQVTGHAQILAAGAVLAVLGVVVQFLTTEQ